MLTLKAAGLLDLDTGQVVRPGLLQVEGELIAGVGGADGPACAGRADGPRARSWTWAS